MTDQPQFRVEIAQNEYLPEGGRDVDAIVTVAASGGGIGVPAADAAEVIVVDCSGSMDWRGKINAAKQATATALDTLRDGVRFAVVAGDDSARMVYPTSPVLATMSSKTRADARWAVHKLRATGGTAMGTWLRLADQLLAGEEGAVRHAILLTDGKNEHETPAEFDAAIAACAGHFTCDCRGVGTDWNVDELRKVATALLGTVDIVAEPAALADDFQAMTAAAMSKQVADVTLRLWTPRGATVRFIKQVEPTVLDLTGRRTDTGPLTGEYPLGSWGQERRDYHVRVEVNPGGVGDEMLAARASVVTGDAVTAQGLIRAIWTADEALSTRINGDVAHYTGQAELARLIQEALAERKAGHVEEATTKFGEAVALATKSGNEATAKLLGKVVDVEDPVTGTVQLKAKVATEDEMTLDTRSTKTVRVKR
jgi:hypothetical protein